MITPHNKLNKQNGFTLIESLLALFILTIGMLGVAGMQLQGLKSGGLSMQHMSVVMTTQNIMERMRANTISYVPSKDFDQISTLAVQQLELYKTMPGGIVKICLNGVECTNAEMALFDLFQWEKDMNNVLPGTVSPTITLAGRTLTVAVEWTDKGHTYAHTVSTDL